MEGNILCCPNAAHIALAEYSIPVITMNIDGLHHLAGSRQVIELHGNVEQVFCPSCQESWPFCILAHTCYCEWCGTLLAHHVVLYGDMLPSDEMAAAYRLMESAEELLIVGTSFSTSTGIMLQERAKEVGARLFVINDRAVERVPLYLKEIQ